MKKIRKGAFETNSSSSHCFMYKKGHDNTELNFPKELYVEYGYYERQPQRLKTVEEKASYFYSTTSYRKDIEEILVKIMKDNGVKVALIGDINNAFASVHENENFQLDYDHIKNVIFNDKVEIICDGDEYYLYQDYVKTGELILYSFISENWYYEELSHQIGNINDLCREFVSGLTPGWSKKNLKEIEWLYNNLNIEFFKDRYNDYYKDNDMMVVTEIHENEKYNRGYIKDQILEKFEDKFFEKYKEEIIGLYNWINDEED